MSFTLLAAPLLALITTDLPVATVLHGEPNASASSTDCVSWWCPQLIVTNTNTTILSAQCKSNKRGVGPWQFWTRSHDGGRTWSARTLRNVDPNGVGQPVYARTTGTLLQIGDAGDLPKAAPAAKKALNKLQATACRNALIKYCNATAASGASCEACINAHKKILLAAGCPWQPSKPASKLYRFCHAPSPGPMDLVWAHQLPQPDPKLLAKCGSFIYRSKDDGVTWTKPGA